MSLLSYVKCCKEVAAEIGVPPVVVDSWTTEAFQDDYRRGIPVQEAVELRIRELIGSLRPEGEGNV